MKPNLDTFALDGGLLQDFAYEYDLAGNILKLHDHTPDSGLLAQPDRLDRDFTYDPLYRLLTDTGRECDITPPPPPAPRPYPWDDAFKCDDATRTRPYTQTYDYDAAGNMMHMHHESTPGAFNRDFAFVPNTNRLQTVTDTGMPHAYQYDANGNLIQENTERHFAWDHADQLIGFANRATPTSPASLEACYLYDAAGQRVKKYVRNQQGQVEVTVYIDGVFEHHVKGSAANNTLHVMDNQSRVAMLRVGNAFPDDGAPNMKVKYHLGDHLGSSSVVIGGADAQGNAFINCEEYYPYGETSFGSFARKRYRFTGKERDEESGLYYHGARYYAPWLVRWVSCDPAGRIDGLNLYTYTRNRPLISVDKMGLAGGEPTEKASKAILKAGQEGQTGSFNQLRGVKINGSEPTIREHLVPGSQLEALTMDPATNEPDYHNQGTEYRKDTVYLNPKKNAMAKTHEHGAFPSDNARTEAVNQMQRDAAKGGGSGANLNKDILVPSIEHAVETGTERNVANKAALEQAGNMFKLQRLNGTGAKVLGGVKAVSPVLLQIILDYEHLAIHAQALEIVNKRAGTVTQEEIEWMEFNGWTVKGVDDKAHKLIWEASLARVIMDRVWLFLHIPDILQANREAERSHSGEG
jgi:RHS repeat-associated protein